MFRNFRHLGRFRKIELHLLRGGGGTDVLPVAASSEISPEMSLRLQVKSVLSQDQQKDKVSNIKDRKNNEVKLLAIQDNWTNFLLAKWQHFSWSK